MARPERELDGREDRRRSVSTSRVSTSRARAEHGALAPLGLLTSVMIPAAIAIIGILALGWGAISWLGAIVWGVMATIAFTAVGMIGKAMGMTRMDLLDLLGSMMAEPGTGASRATGAVIHHMNGALLAVAWAYGTALIGVPANWLTGLAWGVILWALALLMMTTLGAVHPAIRRGEQDDPGPAATNFGRMTPVGSLIGHLVYGLALGFAYAAWPLA
jgi:fatty acid desaturase